MRSAASQPRSTRRSRLMSSGIAGEGGERGVGRAAVAGGVQRQNLPEALLGGGEEVDKGVCRRAEVADAAVGGQRGDVQQNSGDRSRS